MVNLERIRNIGISAHIDAGKTTLTERVLYYTGRIHKIEEVRGGGSGPKMDFMELEREKGITITSAATSLEWEGTRINLVDTPGHVDFTIEVERALRSLDGAIMVLCAVGGVQSQTISVDRQMKRYRVPRLTFINKMDRMGADPHRVLVAMKEKLKLNPVLVQIPIGSEDNFGGVIDLIDMQAVTFEGEKGELPTIGPIPEAFVEKAEAAREAMLDELSMHSDTMMEQLLEGQEVPSQLIHETLRAATLALDITPVFLGSAYRNKGVQSLLDAVVHYLPSPLDREPVVAQDPDHDATTEIVPDPDGPLVALAFKLTEETFGQLTYVRVYSGTLRKGDTVVNSRTKRKLRVGRLVRMHANDREDADAAFAGDIIAIIGLECASGDTFCSVGTRVALEDMFVPDPVITLAISPKKRDDAGRMSKALNRFMREDPTFKVRVDPESHETLIAGMGELHLEIYTERMRREYSADVEVGAPRVAYRETCRDNATFDHRHRKQTGGSGQYAHVVGRLEPTETPFEFESKIVGGTIPKEYIPACEKGFRDACEKGPMAGFPVTGVRIVLEDGSSHDVDSSEMAFRIAARFAMRQAFAASKPVILEPIMMVEIDTPNEFVGPVQGDLSSRRGILFGSEMGEEGSTVRAEVPLAEMFGYATDLRSLTQGKAAFSMEFAKYKPVPASIQTKLIDDSQREREQKQKHKHKQKKAA